MNQATKILLSTAVLLSVTFYSCEFFDQKQKTTSSESPAAAETAPEVQVIKQTEEPVIQDTSITVENGYSNMFLDTADLNSFITKSKLADDEKENVKNFYIRRNYEYAWFDSTGMNEQALHFMSSNRSYISLMDDKELDNKKLVDSFNQVIEDSAIYDATQPIVTNTELQLTAQFFRYAKKAYKTGPDEVVDLNWFIPKKKVDLQAYLQQVASDSTTKQFEPSTPQYQKLKETLKEYVILQQSGGWDTTLKPGKKAYRLGQKSPAIIAIKKRLYASGDLQVPDTTNVFDENLVAAVNRFAHSMGFKEDSAVGANLITEMNRPVSWRIQQIIINMERLRWAPAHLPDNYISVNIPEYKLHMYEGGKPAWDMDIVVGNAQNSTVVFSSKLRYVVFSPYWNVPHSITKKEMGHTASYFRRNNMEVVGKWGDGVPKVRQKPGGDNALGGVKFLFPNEYDIYFHDTPAKDLFERDKRAFSHGCIRLAEPERLASYLLSHDTAWSADSIQTAMHKNKEMQVTLPEEKRLSVFISYYTAWVDDQGQVNFRPDIYHHDQGMARRLFF